MVLAFCSDRLLRSFVQGGTRCDSSYSSSLETGNAIVAFICFSQNQLPPKPSLPEQTTRFRQAIGLVVRIIMENNGWRKTGRKGSLGVRAKPEVAIPKKGAATNNGGLSVWFTRAERYELKDGMPFRPVEERSEEIQLLYVLAFIEID